MSRIYGLTPRTAGQLRQLLADGGEVGGRQRGYTAARGVTWVKVTDAPDADGWHAGVVSLDRFGEFVDLDLDVWIAAADESGLAVGVRYLCTRTGDDDDDGGHPCFRTMPHGGLLMGVLDGAMSYGGSATMSIWAFNGSADADTGANVTVYDWLLSTGQTIASGKRVVAAFVGGRWRVIAAQCS